MGKPGSTTSHTTFIRAVETKCSMRSTRTKLESDYSPGSLRCWKEREIKEISMTTDNIFSGLKVVDFTSFIAGPGAAVILSDFGADVIKVEPPSGDTWRIGNHLPPYPQAKDPYQWHLANRNKRGITLDLKSPGAQQILERLAKWADVFIVNTPHRPRKKLKLEYEDVAQLTPRVIYAALTGYDKEVADAEATGFDITAYWARSSLLALTR